MSQLRCCLKILVLKIPELSYRHFRLFLQCSGCQSRFIQDLRRRLLNLELSGQDHRR
uniref:Uncharacterized protein n=1 Tax=Arundo donax TaxID=35708 RepID=A0A0A9EUU8_ARUDO